MKKRIGVLYTGGTIGMRQSLEGLRPDVALASKALLPFEQQFEFEWHICDPLIDSSAIQLSHWQEWVALIITKISQYDGILVLHGTDTMAYTANFLALAIQSLHKPIVLTGSQWPFDAVKSDATLNLAVAVAAFQKEWMGVAVAFNGKLYPAVGISKISTENATGFANAHFNAIGAWSEQQGWTDWNGDSLSQHDDASTTFAFKLKNTVKVAVYWLAPGCNADMIAKSLSDFESDAAVLMTYGHGNAPASGHLISSVKKYTATGKHILNISQVLQGSAADTYAQGSALRKAGVIVGGKANIETAVALMHLSASQQWPIAQITQVLRNHQLL